MFNHLINKLEIRQFRYFVGIVDARSLTRAAAVLNVAQPALSQQMMQLEEILGVKLLNRSRTGVRPTQAGQAFYRHAQSLLKLVGETGDTVTSTTAKVSGRIRLALPSSLTGMLTPSLMRSVRTTYDGINLEIHESPSGYLSALLLDERVDMCIVVEKPSLGSALLFPLVRESLFYVTKQKKRTALLGESVKWEALGDSPMILTTRATTLRQIVDRQFEIAGIKSVVHAEVSAIPTVLQLVQEGLGATIVPGSALAHVPRAGTMLARQIVPTIQRSATLAVSSTSFGTPACTAVRLALIKVVDELITSGAWIGATSIQE